MAAPHSTLILLFVILLVLSSPRQNNGILLSTAPRSSTSSYFGGNVAILGPLFLVQYMIQFPVAILGPLPSSIYDPVSLM